MTVCPCQVSIPKELGHLLAYWADWEGWGGRAGQAQHGWETLPTAAEIQDNYGGLNRARQSKLGMRAVKGAVSDTWQPGMT